MQKITIQFENLTFGKYVLYDYLAHIYQMEQIVNVVPNWQMVIYPPNENIIPFHFVVYLQKSNVVYAKYLFSENNIIAPYYNLLHDLKQNKLL